MSLLNLLFSFLACHLARRCFDLQVLPPFVISDQMA